MSQPTTAIYLNKTTPASPARQQNIVFATDGATPQQSVTASDPVMVGDTGSGGLAGNVPAPPAGSAAAGSALLANGTWGTPASDTAVKTGAFGITVDGGQSSPTTGIKGYLKVPYNCTIIGWTLMADQSGSVAFNIKSAASVAGIGSTTSIVASAPPALSSAQALDSTTLTGWTTALTAGMLIEFDLTSITTIVRVTLEITVVKS